MARYVVLHHRILSEPSSPGDHFDWMFDQGESLWTWATDEWPTSSTEITLLARRLPDHRRIYLSFEGELTEGRGTVTRVESGSFIIRHATQNQFEFEVSGERTGIISFDRVVTQRTASDGKSDGDEETWYWSFRPTRTVRP